MSTADDFITDYEKNKADIEKWMSIKCEQKYRQFAVLLEKEGVETTWKKVADLYRYDKRLLFNAFRYISFEEEYLRAKAVRVSEDQEKEYKKLQGKTMDGLIKELKDSDLIGDDEMRGLEKVKALRNAVSHNRIILEEKDAEEEFISLFKALPEEYRKGFAKNIHDCTSGLDIPQTLIIRVGPDQ
jgi:hypothetical protein